jgi:phage baseplate assembly protein gpV
MQTTQGLAHRLPAKVSSAGDYSHAEGFFTVTSGSYQHAQGQYNLSSSAQSAFIIGNGTGGGVNRSNLVFASGSQFEITGSLTVLGNITSSNNISASGIHLVAVQHIRVRC